MKIQFLGRLFIMWKNSGKYSLYDLSYSSYLLSTENWVKQTIFIEMMFFNPFYNSRVCLSYYTFLQTPIRAHA